MGIRGIERRLAAELCYEAVATVVHEYLEESRQAGRLLWPHDHLVVPIIRAGYYPPGLLGVKHFIYRHQDVARAERKHMGEEAGEPTLPDEDLLIEEIMWPYPTARLRARQRREATRLLVERQARESRRQDATKCNTLQHNEAASDPATKASGAHPEGPDPRTVAHYLEEMEKRTHYESLRDSQYRLTIDPPPESAPGKGRGSRQTNTLIGRRGRDKMQRFATECNTVQGPTRTACQPGRRGGIQDQPIPAAAKTTGRNSEGDLNADAATT